MIGSLEPSMSGENSKAVKLKQPRRQKLEKQNSWHQANHTKLYSGQLQMEDL